MTKSKNIRPPLVPWTKGHDATLTARYPHEKTDITAAALGRSVRAVYGRATLLSLKKSAEFLASPASGRTNGAIGRSSRFSGGHASWNKGRHSLAGGRSIETQFKPGANAHNALPVGSVTIRVEATTGRDRAWVKIAEPNVWRQRAVVAWEAVHGPVPRGLVIHHRDRDSLNDVPDNLQALTRKQHADEHRAELLAARSVTHERQFTGQAA